MNTEYPGFQNWWRPVRDGRAEYLPEYSPVRLWPETLSPGLQTGSRDESDRQRVFSAWWVAPGL